MEEDNDLLKKDQPFTWKEEQQAMLDILKLKFTTVSILAYPNTDSKFRLETDISNYVTRAVLSTLKDEKWHPVAFSLHSISPQARNYSITDK